VVNNDPHCKKRCAGRNCSARQRKDYSSLAGVVIESNHCAALPVGLRTKFISQTDFNGILLVRVAQKTQDNMSRGASVI
jgi:hypothetical protein